MHLSSPINQHIVASLRITFRICISWTDTPDVKIVRREKEIDTSTDHWDLLLVLPACSASESISFEKRRSPCRKDGNSKRYLFACVPNTKAVLSYSHSPSLRATGYKSFPNIGLTYRFENSAARKQPICIRITRNVPRDVRLLDASACLTRRRMPQGEKGATRRENSNTSGGKRGGHYNGGFALWSGNFSRCIIIAQVWNTVPKLIDAGAVIDIDLFVAYKNIRKRLWFILFSVTNQPVRHITDLL